MNCPACDFESKYGTESCPRPVPNLDIHQCGQLVCPQCNGYTVINGAPMGPFAVAEGDPCPLCATTGRVTKEIDASYVRPCWGVVEQPDSLGNPWRSCRLPLSHQREGTPCQ